MLRPSICPESEQSTKKAELDLILRTNKIDIAAISGTIFSPNRRFSITRYTALRSDRNRFGEGVMLTINNKIRHDQYCLPKLTGLEATAISLYLQKQTATVRLSIPPAHIYSSSYRSRLHLHPAQLGNTSRWP